MKDFYELNSTQYKPWKKALCVLLSVIIAFGTFIALTVGSSRLQDWLGIQSMLSAYASEIVDTKGAIAVDKAAMLEDSNIIELTNKDGSNTVYLFSEPISYTDENGNLKTKDISVEKQTDKKLKSDGYEYANGQNDYRINFSKDSNKGLYIEFGESSYSIIPQSNRSVTGTESTSEILDEQFENFEYPNIYGEGTNLKFYPQLNGVKDEIVLNSNIGQNIFSFKLTTSNCTAVLNDDGTISLIGNDNNESVQTFTAPFAFDSEYVEGDRNEHYIDCSYTLDKIDDNTYIMSVNVDKSWLESENTVYPVTIDPATGNLSYSEDAGVYSAKSSNNYGSEQTCCFGRASEYGYGRVLNYFKMPADIKKGAVINSAYSWQRETTGRTTTTKVTPYVIIGGWTEGSVTYANKPNFTKAVSMASKTINAKSTDNSSNSNWYKFNIAPAIKAWANGTQHNYGLMFISSEEADGNYNWRAFTSRSYSTSAMRPYYVINYTNDTTAPTITSVTGNPTSWTNGNVTLTVNGAKDESGGSGLHSTPYSFSTTKGSYSWQSAKTKTFSSNCTVYIYVRDVQGNIRLASTQTINKIDKTAPTAPTVTGNPTSWTRNCTLTASSTDSGSSVAAYSFSTQQGTYSWQTSKTKQITANGTIYVYAKDSAGNISAATTVKVNKIDRESPVINNVSIVKNPDTNLYNVTIDAEDYLSGIAEYTFDCGETWQSDNYAEIETLPESLFFAVRDNAGNLQYKLSQSQLPVFYEEGNLIGIYNPDINSIETIQYKIGEDGEWMDYVAPFAVPLDYETIVYAKTNENQISVSKILTPDTSSIGTYTESNTDFSLAYKNVSFDFIRTYDSSDRNWFFATDSNVSYIDEECMLISAVLPDSTKLTFIRTSDNSFKNEINGYTLTETSDGGYVLQIDGVNYTYGTDGKLVSISNKYDDTITIARTTSSITIKDGANRAYTLALDSNGNIVSATDPANNVITYTYDNNNLTKVVDQAGVTLGQYSYTNGILTKSMDKTINYNSSGRVTSYEYDSGAFLNYTYDDVYYTVSTVSSTENTTSQTYNDALMIVSSTDEEGNTTEYEYDEYYRVITEIKDGNKIRYTYDLWGNLKSEVSDDENAENTYYTYDTNGNVIRQQTGKNYTYSVYNENNELVLSATLKENYTGTIPEQYNADSDCFDTVTYTYENGILVKTVDSKTKETVTNTYDECGNSVKVTTVTEKDGSSTVGTTHNTYDIMGNLLTAVSGEDTSSYIYDKAGRTLLANEKGDCTRTIYDSLGRTIQEISPEDYDSTKDGLPSENTYADAKAGQTYKYAANGTLTSETNRLGKTTKYFYNDIGCKVREEFDIYKFYYLNHGELYQVKVANTTTVSYSYSTDGKHLLLSENYANDEVIRYTYNDNGNVTAQYHNSNAKPYVTYTYNADNELTEKVNTDTGLKYVYSGENKVDVYKTSDNTLVQSYNETETEADETNNIPAKTDISETHFGINYSSVVKDKSVSYTSGNNTVAYSYQTSGDDDDKIASDSVKFNDTVSLSTKYSYDDNGNVTNKLYSIKQDDETYSVGFVNQYDDKGKITALGYDEVSQFYAYDTDDQLVRVDSRLYSPYTSTYTYDARGNVTSKNIYDYTTDENITSSPKETTTFTYANFGWKDLLVAVNDVELTYDEVGNVLTYGDKEFTWNTGRNLESIVDGDNNYSYTYDENGIRTSKTVNSVTTYYNTKDGVILSQSDGTNTMYFQYDMNGTPLGFIYNGTQYLYMTNQMGDVIAITDADGEGIVEYEYDEWGKVLNVYTANEDNAEQSEVANANPLRYRGYYYDAETGYYYLQSRYYDASICRFINADIPEIAQMSKGIAAGTNLYTYCNNNPINNVDNNGKVIATVVIKALAKMLLGVLAQYVSDIIYNICAGRTGKSAFRPSSSWGSYVSAALTALVPGNKLTSLIARATISTAIDTFENTIKNNKRYSLKTIIRKLFQNFALEMCCSVISSAFANKLNSLKPKNYSQFAHSQYLKNAKMTPNQIKNNMKRLSKQIMISIGVFDFFVSTTSAAVSRKF